MGGEGGGGVCWFYSAWFKVPRPFPAAVYDACGELSQSTVAQCYVVIAEWSVVVDRLALVLASGVGELHSPGMNACASYDLLLTKLISEKLLRNKKFFIVFINYPV